MILNVGEVYQRGSSKREIVHLLAGGMAWRSIDTAQTKGFEVIWRTPAKGFYRAGKERAPTWCTTWMDWVSKAEKVVDAKV